MTRNRLRVLAFLPLFSLAASCGGPSTSLQGAWKDPTYTGGPVDDILIIGVAQEDMNRRMFESEMVASLAKKGVNAVASSSVMATNEDITKENVEAAIQGQKIDAILITRQAGVDKQQEYVPGTSYVVPYGYYNNWYGYYSRSYQVVNEPGYTVENTIVNLESNLYDASDEHLIWAAASQAYNPRNAMDVINPLAKIIVDNLAKEGLIAKKQ